MGESTTHFKKDGIKELNENKEHTNLETNEEKIKSGCCTNSKCLIF